MRTPPRTHVPQAALFIVALTAIACTPEFDSETPSALIYCDDCGENSPLVDGVPFNELALDGGKNAHDTKLLSVRTHNGAEVELVVRRDQLWGRFPLGGQARLQAGATLEIQIENEEINNIYELEIAAVQKIPHWVDPHADRATAYHFQEVVTEVDRRNLCPEVQPDPNIDLPQLPQNHFFAFTGDRYDFETGEVTTGQDADGWVTFACSGSAPAKLHFTRHTLAGANTEYSSDLAARQALMYVYRADFCGNGIANTTAGHPLRYIDANNWFEDFYSFEDDVSLFEALWDENGAVCLDEPRLESLSAEDITCAGDPIPLCKAMGAQVDWGDWGSPLFASGTP